MPTQSSTSFNPLPLMLAIVACVFSVDIYIPSMPVMAEAFGTSQEMMQFSISAGLIGTSLATPIIGPISDAVGRWRILVFSQIFFTLACFATIFATNIETFIFCRFVQGIGGAAAFAIGFACVTDVFKGTRAAIYISYLTTTITLSLVVAPLFGGAFAAYLPWQAAFVFLTALAALSTAVLYWRLPETLQAPNPFSIRNTFAAFGSMMADKRFMVMATVPSLLIGGIIVFMSTGAFYFINELGIPAVLYGVFQGIIMFCNTMASYLSGRLIERLGLTKTTLLGVTLFSFGSLSFAAIALWAPEQTAAMIFAVSLYASGLGLTFNTMTAQSMDAFRHKAGTASSAISFLRGLLIAGCISFGSQIYDGTLRPIALFLAGITVLCVVMYFLAERRSRIEEESDVLAA